MASLTNSADTWFGVTSLRQMPECYAHLQLPQNIPVRCVTVRDLLAVDACRSVRGLW